MYDYIQLIFFSNDLFSMKLEQFPQFVDKEKEGASFHFRVFDSFPMFCGT